MDLMSNLFLWDLDIFLQKVFLYLDIFSLRAASQVCTTWNYFINHRLLFPSNLRPIILSRIWSQSKAVIHPITSRGSITSLDTSEDIVAVGYVGGRVDILNTTSDLIDTLEVEDLEVTSTKVNLMDIDGDYYGVVITLYGRREGKLVCDMRIRCRGRYVYSATYNSTLVDVSVWGDVVLVREVGGGLVSLVVKEDMVTEMIWSDIVLSREVLDVVTNGWWMVAREKDKLTINRVYQNNYEKEVDLEVLDMVLVIEDYLVVLETNCVVTLKLGQGREISRRRVTDIALSSVRANSSVILVLDTQNTVYIYKITGLIQTETDIYWCNKIQLPVPTNLYTRPLVSLNQTSIVCAELGSNQLLILDFWSGYPEDQTDNINEIDVTRRGESKENNNYENSSLDNML